MHLIIDLPAPVSPVIIENPFEKSMLNFLLTHSFLSIKWLSLMMYFLYKNLNLLNNYIINLVFNHFPFARIQGDVLFKLSIKSEMLLLGLLKNGKNFI
jgi:hypothetical protein